MQSKSHGKKYLISAFTEVRCSSVVTLDLGITVENPPKLGEND